MPSRHLGRVRAVDAESFGEPGHRTFRLIVLGEDGERAATWMEKEQFQALSLALKQMLQQLDRPDTDAAPLPEPFAVGDRPDIEFKAGRLGMGYAEEDNTIVLFVYDIEDPDEEDATLIFHMTPDQGASLTHRLDDIIAAGRPVCFLCGASIDPGGHVCVRANGHRRQAIPPPDEP